jgi:hypothetical protein
MKKIILSQLLLACYGATAQIPFTLSHPIHGAVYQRNQSGNVTIYFCGQAHRTTAYYIDYRLHTLDKYGNTVSTSSWENAIATVSSSNQRIFRFEKTLGTGWYYAQIRVRDSGGTTKDTHSVKFGVGEVFVIAGQSNALGVGPDTYGISGLDNLDCVVSGKTMLNYYNPNIKDIAYPSFGPLNMSNASIGPNGSRTWFYQKLGNDIANNATSGKITPVMFFNVAVGGSSVYNWKSGMLRTRKMFSNNYSNNINTSASTSIDLTKFPKDSPWGDDMTQHGIFTRLKTVLSLYGNVFGVRAVLWHQGESETRTLLNTNFSPGTYFTFNPAVSPSPYTVGDYRGILEELINESRVILPGLKWAISKVSLISEVYTPTSATHFNIVNNALRPSPHSGKSWLWSSPAINPDTISSKQIGSNNVNLNVIKQQGLTVSNNASVVSWFVTGSDNYPYHPSTSKRQSDHVHFNSAGLSDLASDAYSNITDAINGPLAKAAVLPTPPPQLNIYNSGGSYYTSYLTAPSGVTYSKFQWEYHYGGMGYNDFDQSTSTTTNSFTTDISTGAWVKDNIGRIHFIPYAAYINIVMGRMAASDSTKIKVYPNPVADASELNIEYISNESKSIKVEIYSENGKLLTNGEDKNAISGTNMFTIKLPALLRGNAYPFKTAYIHIIDKDRIEKRRLLIK